MKGAKKRKARGNEQMLMEACQMAYRKHVAQDESIGWVELGDVLGATLAGAMGDKEFVRWSDKFGHKGKPIVD